MPDLETILKIGIPTAATTIGGAIGAMWRMRKSFVERLHALETTWKHFSEHDYPRERAEASRLIDALRTELQPHLQTLKDSVHRHDRKHTDAQVLFLRNAEKHNLLEARVHACEEALIGIKGQLSQFVQGQNEKWQDMIRTMGQLEGYMKGVQQNPTTSKMFPGTAKKPPP